jgi:hypothetical protein
MHIQMRVAMALDTGIAEHESIDSEACSAGAADTPEVGDEAPVTFEHGDPRHAYLIGSLWGSKDEPPVEAR